MKAKKPMPPNCAATIIASCKSPVVCSKKPVISGPINRPRPNAAITVATAIGIRLMVTPFNLNASV